MALEDKDRQDIEDAKAEARRSADEAKVALANVMDKNFHDYFVTVLEQAVGLKPWQGTAGAKERAENALAAMVAVVSADAEEAFTGLMASLTERVAAAEAAITKLQEG